MKDINALMVIHFWFNINWGCFLVVHECWQRSKFWQLFKYVMLSLGLKSKVGKLGLCHLLKKKKEKENKCECVWCILPWVGPVAFLCPCDSVPGPPCHFLTVCASELGHVCVFLQCLETVWRRSCLCAMMIRGSWEIITWKPTFLQGGQKQLEKQEFFALHSTFLFSNFCVIPAHLRTA